jgi:hypothetical protein
MAEPQLLQVPRHTVLSQVRSSEAPEGMKRLAIFQLHFPANLPEAVSQNVALCQRSARPGMEKKPRGPAANRCFQQRSKGRRYVDFPDSVVRFRSLNS